LAVLITTFAAHGADLREINPPAAPDTNSSFALTGARLIDGRGGPPIADSVVVVRGTTIAAAGPRSRSEFQRTPAFSTSGG
jgi:hypothetical protein